MLELLFVAAALVVVLIVLYMLARRFPLFGESLAFVCTFVARLLVTGQDVCEKAATYCSTVFAKSLQYPPHVTDDIWHGMYVISRLLLFLVSGIILTGDVYGMLQALPLLFGGAGAVSLPGSFIIPSALMFVAMSALYGSVVLECAGLLPPGAHLFPHMTETMRKWLGVLCGIGFVLSLVFAVLFWVFRGWFLADPDSAQVLAIPVFALVGLLITGSSVLALWGLVIGLTGLLSVAFWLVSCGFHGLASVFSLLPSLLDVLALHFTQGRMSVYGELLGHEPYKPPASPFLTSSESLPGRTAIGLLPNQVAAGYTDDVQGLPVLPTEKENTMNPDQSLSIVTTGDYGWQMRSYIEPTIARLRASDRFLTSGHIAVSALTHGHIGIPGTVDLSPTSAERTTATLRGGSEGDITKTLLCCTGDKLTAIHVTRKALPAPLLFLTDCHYLVEGIEMHEAISQRLPLHPQVVVTSVSAQDAGNTNVAVGLSDLKQLVAEDIIAQVMVTDPHSPFALHYGGETLNQFLAQFVVCLLIAQKHSPRNGSCLSLLHMLRSLSPFTTLSFASEPVAVGAVPTRWSWVPFVKGHAGVGNFSDYLAGTRAAIDRVFRDEKTRAFPAEVHLDASCVVVCTAPYALNDPRFEECVKSNKLYVGTHYPYATCLTVSGNGCAYPYHLGSKYVVTVSLLYPLAPSFLPQLQAGKQVQGMSEFPEASPIEPTNGHTHTEPLTQEAKTTPAVSSQPQIAAPVKRGRAKQTKAGK